jgi:putative oxidoreductase
MAGESKKGLNVALWVVQGLLALAFLGSGGMKLKLAADPSSAPPEMAWVKDMVWLVLFIGLSEVAGALGLLLPAALRIKPVLTAWAGVGLTVVMVLAVAFHVSQGDAGGSAPALVLGALSAFVAWGRFKAAPIAPK